MNNKYFRDDNLQRAREITSPQPINNPVVRWNKQTFTPEEKREILTRVKAIGVLRTAIEFGMNKKVILRWLDEMTRPESHDREDHEEVYEHSHDQTINAEVVKDKIVPSEPEENNKDHEINKHDEIEASSSQIKRNKDFTPEEKAFILSRVKEIGFNKAAREAGTTKSTLIYWNYVLKIKPEKTQQSSETVITTTVPEHHENNDNGKQLQEVNVYQITNLRKNTDQNALELENAILREKLQSLTKQLEKVRSAIEVLK